MLYSCLNIGKDANYAQWNNVREYIDQSSLVKCSETALAMFRAACTPNFDGWAQPFGGDYKMQPEDYLDDFFWNKLTIWPLFLKIRDEGLIMRKGMAPEQIPQYHPLALQMVFGFRDAFFTWEWTALWTRITEQLMKKIPVELCIKDIAGNLDLISSGNGRGHYVLANQYDSDKELISFKDPAPEVVTWKRETMDANGNKWFGRSDLFNINNFYVSKVA